MIQPSRYTKNFQKFTLNFTDVQLAIPDPKRAFIGFYVNNAASSEINVWFDSAFQWGRIIGVNDTEIEFRWSVHGPLVNGGFWTDSNSGGVDLTVVEIAENPAWSPSGNGGDPDVLGSDRDREDNGGPPAGILTHGELFRFYRQRPPEDLANDLAAWDRGRYLKSELE